MADADTLPEVDGGFLAEGGLAVERDGILEREEELA